MSNSPADGPIDDPQERLRRPARTGPSKKPALRGRKIRSKPAKTNGIHRRANKRTHW